MGSWSYRRATVDEQAGLDPKKPVVSEQVERNSLGFSAGEYLVPLLDPTSTYMYHVASNQKEEVGEGPEINRPTKSQSAMKLGVALDGQSSGSKLRPGTFWTNRRILDAHCVLLIGPIPKPLGSKANVSPAAEAPARTYLVAIHACGLLKSIVPRTSSWTETLRCGFFEWREWQNSGYGAGSFG